MTSTLVDQINHLVVEIHADNRKAGWWNDPSTGEPIDRTVTVVLSKLMLVVTEIAEAAEGARKGLMDDKLP